MFTHIAESLRHVFTFTPTLVTRLRPDNLALGITCELVWLACRYQVAATFNTDNIFADTKERSRRETHLFFGLRLVHVVPADLDLRLEQRFGEVDHTDAEQCADLLRDRVVGHCGLIGRALLLELHVAERQHRADDLHHRCRRKLRTRCSVIVSSRAIKYHAQNRAKTAPGHGRAFKAR